MSYKNDEDRRAYDREWRKKKRREQPEAVRAAERLRHKNRSPETLEQRRVVHNEWRKKDPKKARGRQLKSRYGITLADHDKMLEEQNGMCALCGKPPYSSRSLSVDHDHATGAIRGLVHQKCNTVIGLAQDSIEYLEKAISYLRKVR